jgi:hypothetical protein
MLTEDKVPKAKVGGELEPKYNPAVKRDLDRSKDHSGRLAQLARALRLHRRSHRFESCIAHSCKSS